MLRRIGLWRLERARKRRDQLYTRHRLYAAAVDVYPWCEQELGRLSWQIAEGQLRVDKLEARYGKQ